MYYSVNIYSIPYYLSIIMLQTVIKVHLCYRRLVYNIFSLRFVYFVELQNGIEYYNHSLIDIRLNILSSFMVLVVLLISPCVLINAIDYLAIIESYLFLLYIPLLQFPTILFTLSNDLIITFLNRDSIGLISYLLINIRSSKISCGIKAVLYNKRGDRFSLLWIAFSHRFVLRSPIGFNVIPLSFRFINLFIRIIFPSSTSGNGHLISTIARISVGFLFIYFTKSAQFPLSSWLLSATAAPTPIPAPSPHIIDGKLSSGIIGI